MTFTRRAILNDDIGLVNRGAEQLGRSAERTLAKRVWNLAINNATYGADGLAWFHSSHGNLGSAALSAASLTAARLALFAQTEPLGLGAGPLFLVVPIQLEATALTLNHCHFLDGSFTLNPWVGKFGANDERIYACPLLTDVTDFYLFDLSGNAGIIEVGFLQGNQAPQLIQANDPKVGQSFSQDRIVLRMRHEYECAISDYRGAYKAVVAG